MISNLQVDNLNRLLINEGIKSQKDFASLLGISTVTVNRWLKGHNAISLEHAKRICEVFPAYDVEFVLGLTDYPNAQSKDNHQRFIEHHIHECVEDIAKHRGLNAYAFSTFDTKAIKENEWREQWPNLDADKFTYFERLENENGKTLTITDEQWDAFVDEVCSYVEMRISAMIERGCW